MNRQELINEMASKRESTKKEASELLELILETIQEGLVEDGKVSLFGFGNFEVKDRAERKGINPQTGEELIIPATKVVKFKASKKLKDSVR